MKIFFKKICSSGSLMSFYLALFCLLFFGRIGVAKAAIVSTDLIDYWFSTGSSADFGTIGRLHPTDSNYAFSEQTFGSDKWGTFPGYSWIPGSGNTSLTFTSNAPLNGGFALSTWYKGVAGQDARPFIRFYKEYGVEHDFSATFNCFGAMSDTWFLPTDGSPYTENQNDWASVRATFCDGNWHNLIVNASSTGEEIYMDGTKFFDASFGASPWYNGIQTLTIGRPNYTFNLDDLALFNRPLTSGEIADLQTNAIADLLTPTAAGLAITNQDFAGQNFGGDLMLRGTCAKYGSGLNQMTIYSATSSANAIANGKPGDPNGYWRGQLVDCQDVPIWGGGTYQGFVAHYNGEGLTGTSTIYVDDTFFGTEMVSVDQNFSATTTNDWSGSVGYMSQDDPGGTAHRLACTDDEWATADPAMWTGGPTMPAFNFVVLKCNIIKDFYMAWFGIRDKATGVIRNTLSTLGGIFPFSVIKGLQTDWDSSTAPYTSFLAPKTALASDFSTTTGIVSSSAFQIKIPNILGTGATSTIKIFDRDTIIGFVGQNVFDIYYTICRLFIWTLFFVFIWRLITQRTHEEIL